MATRWRFPFAKAVPSDDALAQWVTGLGLGLNDLVHSHKRLFEGLAGDEPTVVEIGYDARLTGSHVWEVSVLLRAGTSNPDLSDFLAGLPASVRADLDAAVAIFDDPEKAAFRGALGRARDHFFHYPEPGRKELRRALAAFGRDGHDGELWLDSDLRNARARWADDVAAQLFVRAEGDDDTAIREFTQELGDFARLQMHLLVDLIKEYFSALPDGVVAQVADR
jgi:hypothetical protein